jgi:hypothetical protein
MPGLLDLPIEVLLEHVALPLSLPLAGLHGQRLSKEEQEELRGNQRALLSLSATCRALREVLLPLTWRTLELPAEADLPKLGDDTVGLVRSLMVGCSNRPSLLDTIEPDEVEALTRGDGLFATFFQQAQTAWASSGATARRLAKRRKRGQLPATRLEIENDLVRRALPRLRRLHLHHFVCTAETWTSLASAPLLETLVVDDHVAFEGVPHDVYHYPLLRHLDLDLPVAREERSGPGQVDKIEACFRLISSSTVFETLTVRAFEAAFGRHSRALFDESLWRTLKVLNLDAGHGTGGLVDVFEGFQVRLASLLRPPR